MTQAGSDGLAIMIFVLAPWIWVGIVAAFAAGLACLALVMFPGRVRRLVQPVKSG